MSEPKHRPTDEEPAVRPTVTTDPARSRWSWSAVPSHLGRARTSTVVLSVLFLAIGALYLNIRPETPATTTVGTSSDVEQSTTSTTPTTTAPESSTAPETTADQPEEEPTTSAPATTTAPSDTAAPTDTTQPTSTPTLPSLTPRTAPNTSPSSPTP